MSTLAEIENAVDSLPPEQKQELFLFLAARLRTAGGQLPRPPDAAQGETESASGDGDQVAPLPDYTARRRRIFGDKVLPNMVLAARAEERW